MEWGFDERFGRLFLRRLESLGIRPYREENGPDEEPLVGRQRNGTLITKHKDQITSVVVCHGISSVGNYAFCNCELLKAVIIPRGMALIGYSAFAGCGQLTAVTIHSSHRSETRHFKGARIWSRFSFREDRSTSTAHS